jgi:hypothetical protein
MRASVLERLAARGGTSAHDWRFGHGRLSRKAVVIDRELICPFWLTKLNYDAAFMRWWRDFSKPLQQALKGT